MYNDDYGCVGGWGLLVVSGGKGERMGWRCGGGGGGRGRGKVRGVGMELRGGVCMLVGVAGGSWG